MVCGVGFEPTGLPTRERFYRPPASASCIPTHKMVLPEGLEPSKTRFLRPLAMPIRLREHKNFGSPFRIRTETVRILSPVTLPVGLKGQKWRKVKDSNPYDSSP